MSWHIFAKIQVSKVTDKQPSSDKLFDKTKKFWILLFPYSI